MSRNSVLVLLMSTVILKSIEDIFLIRDFLIFPREVPEDCFIIAWLSSLYKPMFSRPVIWDIYLLYINLLNHRPQRP